MFNLPTSVILFVPTQPILVYSLVLCTFVTQVTASLYFNAMQASSNLHQHALSLEWIQQAYINHLYNSDFNNKPIHFDSKFSRFNSLRNKFLCLKYFHINVSSQALEMNSNKEHYVNEATCIYPNQNMVSQNNIIIHSEFKPFLSG
jgi:hypothetical protein